MDPFEVPLERKLEPLLAADAALRAQAGVVLARTSFRAFRQETVASPRPRARPARR